MIKPDKLKKGDTIATISPSWGCAGAPRVLWKYRLGCERLKQPGLNVVAAPNSLPVCIIPYGAMAELNIDKLEFSILES